MERQARGDMSGSKWLLIPNCRKTPRGLFVMVAVSHEVRFRILVGWLVGGRTMPKGVIVQVC